MYLSLSEQKIILENKACEWWDKDVAPALNPSKPLPIGFFNNPPMQRKYISYAKNTADKDRISARGRYSTGRNNYLRLEAEINCFQGGGRLFRKTFYITKDDLLNKSDKAPPLRASLNTSPKKKKPPPNIARQLKYLTDTCDPDSDLAKYLASKGMPLEVLKAMLVRFGNMPKRFLQTEGTKDLFTDDELVQLPDLVPFIAFLTVKAKDLKRIMAMERKQVNNLTLAMERRFANGVKLRSAGSSDEVGCHPIGGSDAFINGKPINICESVTTGYAIYQALNEAVVCTLGKNNFAPVAKIVGEQYPNSPIIFRADNDKKGDGLLAAIEAAQETARGGNEVNISCPANKGQDYNDVMQQRGIEGIKKTLSRCMPPITRWAYRLFPSISPNKIYETWVEGLLGKQAVLPSKVKKKLRKLIFGVTTNAHKRLDKLMPQYDKHDVSVLNDQYINRTFSPTYSIRQTRTHDGHIQATIVLHTPMGTGKTYTMRQELNRFLEAHPGQKAAIVVPRQALARELAEKLGAVCYLDLERDEKGMFKDIPRILVVCINSLPAVPYEEGELGLLLVDEIEQNLKAIAGGTVREKEKTLATFSHCLRTTPKIMVADAYLSPPTLQYLEDLRPGHRFEVITNRYQRGKGLKAIVYKNKSTHTESLFKALGKDQRALLATNSCDHSYKAWLEVYNRFSDKKILLINAKTCEEPEVVQFLSNPAKYVNLYDCIIYSPTISSGVSIDADVTQFDWVGGVFYGQVGSPFDALQQLARYRGHCNYHLYIQQGPKNRLTDPTEILVRMTQADKNNTNLLAEIVKKTDLVKEQGIRDLVDLFKRQAAPDRPLNLTAFERWFSELAAYENRLINDYKNILLLELQRQGYKLEYEEVAPKNATLDKDMKKAYADYRIEQLMAAPAMWRPGLSIEEQKQVQADVNALIQSSQPKTEADNFKIERALIEIFHQQSLSPPLINWDDKGKKRPKIRNIELAIKDLPELIYEELLDQNTNPRTHHKLIASKRWFLEALFKCLNITVNDNGTLNTPDEGIELNPKSKEVKDFFKWVIKHKVKLEQIDRFSIPPTFNQNLRWLSGILKNFIGVTPEVKQVRINKVNTRKYYITNKGLKALNECLARRFLNHENVLKNDPKKADFSSKIIELKCSTNASNIYNNLSDSCCTHPQPSREDFSSNKEGGYGGMIGFDVINQLKQAKSHNETIEILEANETTQKDDHLWEVVRDTLNDFKDSNLSEIIIDYLLANQPVSATPSKAPQLTKTNASWANPDLTWHQRLQDFYLNVKKGVMEEWLKIKNTNPLKWNELKAELERYQLGYQYAPNS